MHISKKVCIFAKIQGLWKKKIKKLGTEKTFKHKCGKIIIGTIDKSINGCSSAYVRLETWITVQESVSTSIEAIRRRLIANRYQVSNTYFEGLHSTIIDYQYTHTKCHDKSGKTSFISIDITLLAKDKFNWNEDFIFNCEAFGDTIFTLLETLSEHFDMRVTKK